jgi:predicted metal-dependent hydrolase
MDKNTLDKDTIVKLLIAGLVIIVIAMLILIIVVVNNFNKKPGVVDGYTFDINNGTKYKIITDAKIMTTKNDGSSYMNVYYQFDFDNNIIGRVVENHPSKYSSDQTVKKEEINKKVDDNLKKEARELIDYIINTTDTNIDGNYRYYTLESSDSEQTIYNTDTINKIKAIFIKVDNIGE